MSHTNDSAEPVNRIELLRRARGMWSGRADLPKLDKLRRELDRYAPQSRHARDSRSDI